MDAEGSEALDPRVEVSGWEGEGDGGPWDFVAADEEESLDAVGERDRSGRLPSKDSWG